MNKLEIIQKHFEEHLVAMEALKDQIPVIDEIAQLCFDRLSDGKKILICGNGGSAADAQHFAAELVVRFRENRWAFPVMALTTDSSILTACGNDFGYERVFSRQVEGWGKADDILIAISTSGNSPNISSAMESASANWMTNIFIGGEGECAHWADYHLKFEGSTAVIQEMHEICLHMIAHIIEELQLEKQREMRIPGPGLSN